MEQGYVIIPPHILGDENLTANDKFVWGLIMGLSNNKGYCFASNEYIAKRLCLKKHTVSIIISKFVKLNYIKRILLRENKEIIERRLYIYDTPLCHQDDTPMSSESYTPMSSESYTPMSSKGQGILNTDIKDYNKRDSSLSNSLSNNPQSENPHADNCDNSTKNRDDLKKLAEGFYEYQYSQYPKQLKEWRDNPERLINDSIDELDKLIRLDGYDKEEIARILGDAVRDDFWAGNVISLRGIRRKSKNGLIKFANMATKLKPKKSWKDEFINYMETERPA